MASYTAFASYYDSLGVLSICDALDSLDGIPASALLLNPYLNSSTKGIDILAGPYPPQDYEQLHLQYQLEQEQEQQNKDQQQQQQSLEHSNTNTTTTTTSSTNINNTNDHNSTDEGLPINGTDVYPMYYARPLQHSEQDLLASNIAAASTSIPTSGISTNSAQSVIATNNTNTALPAAISAVAPSSRTSISIPSSSTTLPIVNGVESSVLAAAAAAVTRKREPKRAHERANSRNPNSSSSSNNGLAAALGGASLTHAGRVSKDRDANGYKIEECPVCGRAFKGPKASTHRQQHIRRLHPQDYIPKRGGKKRVVVE